MSLYSEGAFTDLCRGPHVPSTGKIKALQVDEGRGAYWRGDHRNEQLQRVYGTAWTSKDDLQLYLTRLEEAENATTASWGVSWICFTLMITPWCGVLAPF